MTQQKIKGLDVTEQEYRQLNCLSYSLLSSLDREGPIKAVQETEPTEPMVFGTMVDQMMDGSFRMKNYYIAQNIDIGEKIKPAIDLLLLDIESRMGEISSSDVDSDLSNYSDTLIYVLNNNDIDYYKKRTAESRAASIMKDAGAIAYFKTAIESSGKTVITHEMLADATECKNILKSHEFTKDIFKKNIEGCDAYYQFKYKWKTADAFFKGMIDRLIIDHNNKKIKPFDLKTGGKPAMNFENSFFFYRYDIQAALYYVICKLIQKEYYPDYEIDNFKFIYISRYEKQPLIWETPFGFLSKVFHGYTKNGRKYKGIKQLIDDYKWYESNSFKVVYPEEVYNNKGVLTISVDNVE